MKKKKVLFHQDNAPRYKLIATMAKLHELHFELLPTYTAGKSKNLDVDLYARSIYTSQFTVYYTNASLKTIFNCWLNDSIRWLERHSSLLYVWGSTYTVGISENLEVDLYARSTYTSQFTVIQIVNKHICFLSVVGEKTFVSFLNWINYLFFYHLTV